MSNCGETHGRAVLTWKDVEWIRENYVPGNKGGRNSESSLSGSGMAKRFGVSHRQIFRILKNENWRGDGEEG